MNRAKDQSPEKKDRKLKKQFYNCLLQRDREREREKDKVAEVVAQLAEQSLAIPEVRVSNPVIGKYLFTFNCKEKTKIKKKGGRYSPFKKTNTDLNGNIN